MMRRLRERLADWWCAFRGHRKPVAERTTYQHERALTYLVCRHGIAVGPVRGYEGRYPMPRS